MSDAFSSVADDAYASYYNPAGLVNLDIPQFGATYTSSFEEIRYQYITFAYPRKIGEVYAISYSGLSSGDIQGYDAAGTKTRIVNASDMSLGFSYSRTVTKDEIERPVLGFGATLKYVRENLNSVSASAFAFDFGLIYSLRPTEYWLKKIPGQEFRFSAVLKSVGQGLEFDKENTPLPTSFILGASWHLHPRGANKLILSVDNVFSVDDKHKVAVGAEYFLFQLMGFRLGYETNKYIGSNVRFGVGFRLSFLDIDYSMTPFGDLGNMHKIGLLFKFGQPRTTQPLEGEVARVVHAKLVAPKERIEKLEMFASDFIKLARKNLGNRKYVLADENLRKAFNLEPSLRKGIWGKREKRLRNIIAGLRLEHSPKKEKILAEKNEQANLADEVIISYINGKELKSFLLAHAAFGTNVRGDAVFEEILHVIGNLTKMKVRQDEILPKGALVNKKLKKSAAAFYGKKFAEAARHCEEAILLDESNELAWTRLGSSYFALGDFNKAKKAYLKVLEINPGNKYVKKLMKLQGWK